MTRIQNSLQSPSMPNTENANHHTSRPVFIQPSINRTKETSSKDGTRAAPGISGLAEQIIFVDNSVSPASAVQKTISLSRNLTTMVAKGIPVAASIGVKVPASVKALSPLLTKFGVQAKVAEIPFRVVTTLEDIKGKSVTDGIVSSIKLATATTEAAADVGNWMATPKKGSAPTTMRPPFQRGQPLSSNSFKMRPLRNSSHATTPSAARMSPAVPSQFYSGRGGPPRLPVRVKPLPPPRLPALTPPWRSVSTSGTTKTSSVATTLSRIGNGAKLLGGGAD